MKLDYKKTILVGMAFFGICTFWQMYDNIIPLILQNTFELKETITGVIMALDNILAIFLLPWFGAKSDGVSTKWGKRMPFIVIGTISAAILLVCLGVTNMMGNLALFILVLLLLLIAMGSYRSPAVALMPDVTAKPLRSKANAIINLMGTLGAVIALVGISLLVGDDGNYMPLFIFVAVFMVITVVILFITVNENKLTQEREQLEIAEHIEEVETDEETGEMLPEVRKSLIFILLSVALWYISYNALTTAFSRFYQNYWGIQDSGYSSLLMIGTLSAVAVYIPVGIIATKVGRKKTILVGVAILVAAFGLGIIFTSYTPLAKVLFVLVGIGWGTINVNSYPMVVEMSKGSDIGKYTGLYYTFSMSAQIITPVLSGFLIEIIGYQALFPYATFFSILAFVTMLQVKHGDVKPVEKKDWLEHLDVDD